MNHRTLEKKVIAFYSPAAGSGKSTACELLAKEAEARGLTVERVSFADPLRQLCAAIISEQTQMRRGVAENFLRDLKDEKRIFCNGSTPRKHYLIPVGEAVRDVFGESFWAEKAIERIEASKADVVLVDDLRRPNEHAALEEIGAELVKILRPAAKEREAQPIEGLLEGFRFDGLLVNGGTLEDLREDVASLLPERTIH